MFDCLDGVCDLRFIECGRQSATLIFVVLSLKDVVVVADDLLLVNDLIFHFNYFIFSFISFGFV